MRPERSACKLRACKFCSRKRCACKLRACKFCSRKRCAQQFPADSFPSQNIRFIVPSGAGGANDLTVRSLIPGMEEYLGGTIIAENITEAAGAAAAVELQKAKPDGHTIYFNSPTLIINHESGMKEVLPDMFQPIAVVC
jgi:tripartite-type tricarboxylate transporter receptor subunit TctC